jgi:hypothetical protein
MEEASLAHPYNENWNQLSLMDYDPLKGAPELLANY